MGEKRIEIGCDWGRGCYRLRFHSNESVELAGAGRVRTTYDHLVASAGHSDLEQDPVRRISRQARLRRPLETPDERTLGADDSRGTGKVSPGYVQLLRFLARACGGI